MGTVLLFQKLIKIYYYSAGFNATHLKVNIYDSNASYDKMLLPNLSTESTTLYNAGGGRTRLEKEEYIIQHPECYDHLLVCYMSGSNCGKCMKCRQTLLELDTLGKLDLFKNTFDIEQYKKDKPQILKYIYACQKEHVNFQDLIKRMEDDGFKPDFSLKHAPTTRKLRKIIKK